MTKQDFLVERARLQQLYDFYIMRVFSDIDAKTAFSYLDAAVKVKHQISKINEELDRLESL